MASYSQRQQGVQAYVKACKGNVYQASNTIAKVADVLVKLTDDSIMESEAVNWALTGEKPGCIRTRIRQHMNLTVPKSARINQILSYVEDSDILECVEESYAQSIRIGAITFYYPVKISQGKKARVRVLTRMCWFNRKEQ